MHIGRRMIICSPSVVIPFPSLIHSVGSKLCQSLVHKPAHGIVVLVGFVAESKDGIPDGGKEAGKAAVNKHSLPPSLPPSFPPSLSLSLSPPLALSLKGAEINSSILQPVMKLLSIVCRLSLPIRSHTENG